MIVPKIDIILVFLTLNLVSVSSRIKTYVREPESWSGYEYHLIDLEKSMMDNKIIYLTFDTEVRRIAVLKYFDRHDVTYRYANCRDLIFLLSILNSL